MTSTPRTRLAVRAMTLVAMDLGSLWAAWWIATTLRLGTYWGDDFRVHNQALFLQHAALFLCFGALFETYDPRRPYARWTEIRKLATGYFFASLAAILLFYFRPQPPVGRGIFALNVLSFVALAIGGRFLYSRIGGSEFFRHRAIVVTSGDLETALLEELARAASSVYKIEGFVAPTRGTGRSLEWLGDGANLPTLVKDQRIDTLIVSSKFECWYRHLDDLMACRYRGIEIIDLASACERFLERIPCEHVTELWFLWGLMSRSSFYVTRVKRLVDLIAASVLLVPALPLMALVAGAIRLTSQGPILYRQERIGQHNRPFFLFKFRSMVEDAEHTSGPVWAQENDPRATSVGRWLRRWRLDELPQLFNVLKGDMSLVGPRPERGIFVSEFLGTLPMYNQRHALRPGITGWGQVKYDYASSAEQSQEKLEYDLFYLKNASLRLDLSILMRTTRTLLGGRGR